MKISRSVCEVCEDKDQVYGEDEEVLEELPEEIFEPEEIAESTSSYQEAKDLILAAINVLGSQALQNNDAAAKDAIANLSVVYFDLQ